MENKPIVIHINIPNVEEVMNLQERMLPTLHRILNYYNMTYNTNMDIIVDNFYDSCCFNTPTNSVVMSFLFIFSYIKTAEARRRHVFNNIEELLITVFLHEVKHGIDYLIYRELYDALEPYSLAFKANEIFGKPNRINYEQLPLEARADLFAHNELCKWIKQEKNL
jgi:hypothetical protein